MYFWLPLLPPLPFKLTCFMEAQKGKLLILYGVLIENVFRNMTLIRTSEVFYNFFLSGLVFTTNAARLLMLDIASAVLAYSTFALRSIFCCADKACFLKLCFGRNMRPTFSRCHIDPIEIWFGNGHFSFWKWLHPVIFMTYELFQLFEVLYWHEGYI